MDVLDMKDFPEGEFNIVFDKALLDSILCGENALDTVKIMLKEIYRVLVDEGYYVLKKRKEKLFKLQFMILKKNFNSLLKHMDMHLH